MESDRLDYNRPRLYPQLCPRLMPRPVTPSCALGVDPAVYTVLARPKLSVMAEDGKIIPPEVSVRVKLILFILHQVAREISHHGRNDALLIIIARQIHA